MAVAKRLNKALNAVVMPVMSHTATRRLVQRRLTLVGYCGPRTGRQYRFPVEYRRQGDEVTIGVGWPEEKKWWRAFRGEGHPLTLLLDGRDRPGHGRALEGTDGSVQVVVHLT